MTPTCTINIQGLSSIVFHIAATCFTQPETGCCYILLETSHLLSKLLRVKMSQAKQHHVVIVVVVVGGVVVLDG